MTLEAFVVSMNQRFITFNAERGVLVLMTAHEVDALEKKLDNPLAPRSSPSIAKTLVLWCILVAVLTLIMALL